MFKEDLLNISNKKNGSYEKLYDKIYKSVQTYMKYCVKNNTYNKGECYYKVQDFLYGHPLLINRKEDIINYICNKLKNDGFNVYVNDSIIKIMWSYENNEADVKKDNMILNEFEESLLYM